MIWVGNSNFKKELAWPEMESSTNCKTKKESANNNSSTFFSLCKDLNYEMTDKKFVLILLQIEKKNTRNIP